MKKSTKKLLGLGTSLLIGSAGVIAGIGALKLDQSGSSINQNNASRAVQNDGFGLTSHDSFIIGKNLNQTEIYNSTPNVTKPVPNGYVTINKNNQLICIDKNDPNKVLWYSNYGSGYNVLATEYTPYEDTLVVLYTDEKRNAGDSVRIKVCKYPNISSKTDGGEFTTWEDKVVNTYTYDGNTFRNDTWGLSPIYKTSTSDGDNAQVTSYLIYPKLHTDNNNLGSWGSDKIFEYSVKDKSVQNRKFKYHYTDRYQAIMGMGSWIYGDKIHAVLLMLRKGSTGSWIEVEYLVQEDNKEYFASKGIKNPGSSADGNFWSGSSWAIISEAVRSNISGAAFSYNYDTSDMKVTFALNAFGGYDAFGNSNNFHKNGQLITTSVWCGGQQFSGTSGPWRNNLWTETWGGYFDNSVIAAKGIKNTTASPLLLEGYDQRIQDASKGYDGRFTAVINNPTSWGNDTFNPTKTLNNSRWRIYMQTDDEAVNASNSTYYSNFSTSVDISQNYRLGLNQGAFGIPVLEYHNDNNNDSTIFNLNVMFMKNGSNNGIIINQKDRGSNTQNPSTYGYYTEAKNKNIEIDMSNEEKPIDEINEQYLTEKYKINSNPWYYSSFLVQNLKMVNVRDDALFYINPNIENLKQDQATFDLYVTIKYNETGNLRTISSEELKNNWNSEFRVCSVTLTGLKVANPTSAIIQTNLGMSNISALDFSLSKNNDEIKRIIFDKRNEIFNNTLPTDFELSNIVSIIEKNVANSEGTITITFSIDKYYNDKGLLEEVEPKNFTIKFIGFKADDRTTSINPQLTNVENILPSQYENNLELIKNSIINNIENVYSPLDINDIEIVFNEPNNLIGTINANIKIINSKALQNGNIQQEFSLNNVVLSGFKTAIQTKIVNPINAITIDLNNKTINESIDLIDELFIFNNLNNFFSGNYEINNVSKIKISKKEIDKVQKRINLEIELSENSAYDVKGNLINKKVKFETYIFNFKQEIQNEETKIISPIQALSLGLNNLSIQEAQNRITNQFILNNKNKFFTGYLNLQNINEIIDLNILISNNSLIVTFKLKVNTWADKNGQLGSTEKDFKTNINGFKKENNKTSNLAQIIGGILLVIGGVLTIGIITFMFIKSKNKKLKH